MIINNRVFAQLLPKGSQLANKPVGHYADVRRVLAVTELMTMIWVVDGSALKPLQIIIIIINIMIVCKPRRSTQWVSWVPRGGWPASQK